MTDSPMGTGWGSRRQPAWTPPGQMWASDNIETSHTEALFAFGEWVMFTMLWRPEDHTAGRVARCSHCFAASRQAEAFKQPERRKCEYCYGTTYEGGFRAQIIRPALVADRNQESVDTQSGEVTVASLMVETTTDFHVRKGDFMFRADGARFQCEEKDEGVARTGFGIPSAHDSFSGTISAAHLEDPTSVGYLIPPTGPELVALLDLPNTHFVPDLSGYAVIRPNGYL